MPPFIIADVLLIPQQVADDDPFLLAPDIRRSSPTCSSGCILLVGVSIMVRVTKLIRRAAVERIAKGITQQTLALGLILTS